MNIKQLQTILSISIQIVKINQCFYSRENIGCTFEYELLMQSTCKELIVPSNNNKETLLYLMNNYALEYEELVGDYRR